MIAAIYLPPSTQHDCDFGPAELQRYARRRGWRTIVYSERPVWDRGIRYPILQSVLHGAKLHAFDLVLVGKMDWFGRSLQSLIANLQVLDSVGIRFVAASQNIDTNKKSSRGKCLMQIIAAFAKFHRYRVQTGMREYQRDYTHGEIGKVRHSRSGRDLPVGRPAKVFRRDQVVELRAQGLSWRAIAKQIGVPPTTVRRAALVSAKPPAN
jgi:putative DNA-invertase from lambdoid prophage Rac